LPSVLCRSRRRWKKKFFGAHPHARLAILKAALAARRNKGVRPRQDTGSDDEGLGKMLRLLFLKINVDYFIKTMAKRVTATQCHHQKMLA
jgi:hypothetical protein